MLEIHNISWLAILISTVIGMVLGALWYSPVLFGNAWMRAVGKTKDELGSPGPAMVGSIVVCLISATAIELLTGAIGANTALAGISIGVIIGFGIVAMAMLSDALFCNWGWPLYFIQAGYRVTYIVLMALVCSIV